ncbi:MAG: UvrD-helicase domain-containing protein, partial [Bacillota bacterium]|nr:UvrD-helicase domain-containing protein [Bacillota bacterium]
MTPSERAIRDELEAKGTNVNFKVNYLVEAGAGAGKTYTMIQRIANQLVSGDCPPEKLVAITFTVKSTQEMKKRLDEELAKRRQNAATEEEKAFLDELIQVSGQMQISTIHSFCQKLLESMPFQSPLGVDMQAMDNDISICRSYFRRRYWEDPSCFDVLKTDWGFTYQELEDAFLRCYETNEAEIVYE